MLAASTPPRYAASLTRRSGAATAASESDFTPYVLDLSSDPQLAY